MTTDRMRELVDRIKCLIDKKDIDCLISELLDIDIEISDKIDIKPELSEEDERFLCYIGEIADLIDDSTNTVYWEQMNIITDMFLKGD